MPRRLVLVLPVAAVALAGAALLAAAGEAEPTSVRLAARPAALVAGRPWTATLVVRPASAGKPQLLASLGAATRRPAVTAAGRGRWRARVVLPTAGRWRLQARLGRRSFALGTAAVRAPAPVAEVTEPFAVALAPDGDVLVADRAANRLVRIDPATAALSVVAELQEPLDVAVGPNGAAFVVAGERVVRVDLASGAVTPFAGTGSRGFGGDGGPATSAPLNAAGGVAVDNAGNVFIAEYENRIRRVDAATGVITTIAGTGAEGFGGDGGPATAARIFHPHGLTFAGGFELFVADTENNRLRLIDLRSGTITTVAGTGEEGFGGDGGPALRATLGIPLHVAPGPDHSLYLVDDARVRRIGGDGVIRTVAGNGLPGSSGDGGPATRASLNVPNHVAVAPDGTFYVVEFAGRRVRRVDGRTGVITTVAR